MIYGKVSQQDWYCYLDYLRSQVRGVDLKAPKSIGEAFNNHMVMQDINDVVENKLVKYVKSEAKSANAKA